ncbi:nucleotidyltransferase and HEPN domain-containing protein [Stakelama sediminis]|uniref:HEPN domain-containing protein n=1 Tax=Stakelama sediminis TaxID=463200 RepID=UPI0031E90FAB
MKSDLDHLPDIQRRELARVREILLEEFDTAIARATSPTRRNGKVYKIVLFGSYARNDWVDEPENGYQSDYDLLIIVSHEDLTDIAGYWYVAEDRILRDAAVNQALSRGEYFWVDIARDGIALYELPCHALATPMPLTPADAYRMAREYFDGWFAKAVDAIEIAEFCVEQNKLNDAAFLMHQATERLYICFLLVRTLYFPRSHNIKFLRSLAEDKEPRLVASWPREQRTDRRRFELLKRAYVEARYSAQYAIARDDLDALAAAIAQLRDTVETLCLERLEALKQGAEG